jgi:hypothetical protein
LVTGGRGGGASLGGDGLVLVSLLMSAAFTVAQARILRGRDPIAVTAVQFLGAALAAVPVSAAEGIPAAPHGAGTLLATLALVACGTLLPFTLFAFGQSRVSAEVAGAFVNIEPLVGAVAGIVFFGNPAGPAQALGGAAIIAGIALSTLPLLRTDRRAQARRAPAIEAAAFQAGVETRAARARRMARRVRIRPRAGRRRLAAAAARRRPASALLRGPGRSPWAEGRQWSRPRSRTSERSARRQRPPRMRPVPTAVRAKA